MLVKEPQFAWPVSGTTVVPKKVVMNGSPPREFDQTFTTTPSNVNRVNISICWGWILKPVHQASHPWLPTSALQGASHPVSNQHNGAPRVPMSTDPVEAVTRKGHQVTMGLLSQDPKWLTTHMCWHAKQCRKCICRMHNLLFNHYATHWGWVKHLTSSIIFMI